jgi:hypothetical protein
MDRLTPEELDFTPPQETAEHFAVLKAEYEAAVASGDEGWIANAIDAWRKKTGGTAALPVEPPGMANFAQALAILQAITAHFQEFGPVAEKTSDALWYDWNTITTGTWWSSRARKPLRSCSCFTPPRRNGTLAGTIPTRPTSTG